MNTIHRDDSLIAAYLASPDAERALAEAIQLQVEHGQTEIVENDGEPDGPAFATVPPDVFASRLLAAWRRTAAGAGITGDYGERQFDERRQFCDVHEYVRDDETTLGDPYAERDAAAAECADCQALNEQSDFCGKCGAVAAVRTGALVQHLRQAARRRSIAARTVLKRDA